MIDIVDMALSPFAECFTLLNQVCKGLQEKRLDRKGLIMTVESCAKKLKAISDAQEERIKFYDDQLKIAASATSADGYTIQFSPINNTEAGGSGAIATTGHFTTVSAEGGEVGVEGEWTQVHGGPSYIIEGVTMNVEDGRIIVGGNRANELIVETQTLDQTEVENEAEGLGEHQVEAEQSQDDSQEHINQLHLNNEIQEQQVYDENQDHDQYVQQDQEEQQVDEEQVLEQLKRRYGKSKFNALIEGAKNGNLKSFIEYGLVTAYECSSAQSLKNVFGCLLSPKCKGLIFKHNLTCLRHILAEHWGGYKPHKCDFCDHRTYLKQQMNIHTPQHTGEGRHKCTVEGCVYSTSSSKAWKIHKARHQGLFLFYCDLCPKGYYNKKDLAAHQNGHFGVNPFVCKLCKRGFKRKVHLTRHMLYHVKPIKCPIDNCDYRTAQNDKLRQHIEAIHAADEASHSAIDVQSQNVTTASASSLSVKPIRKKSKVLERRIQNGVRQREDGSYYYRCVINDCNLNFDCEDEFRDHVYDHFPIPEQYPCRWKGCDRVFNTAKQRNIHVRYGHLMDKNAGFKLLPTPKINDSPPKKRVRREDPQPKEHTFTTLSVHPPEVRIEKEPRKEDRKFICRFPECQFITTDSKKLESHQLHKHKLRPFCPV